MTTALVLAGHGSHISPRTGGVVWDAVDSLRRMGIADEITAAFWKEAPPFARVLRTLGAEEITVVPLLTASGYFTRTVIPAEMGLTGAITERDGRTIRLTPPIGEHPRVAGIIRRRVEAAMQQSGAPRDQVAVVLIGHGTKRHADSRAATEAQAQAIRAIGLAREVVAVYLDDTPSIPDAYRLTSAPVLIVVPFFLAPGSHTTIDVPEALGLPHGARGGEVHGRAIHYTDPVGTDSDLIEIVMALAGDAGTRLREPVTGSSWDGFPTVGRRALWEAVSERGSVRFGELQLTPFQVTVAGDSGPLVELDDPGVLRARVRENPFRSLATARGMPGGWRVRINGPTRLHAVVETVYPGAVADWVLGVRQGANGFEQAIRRQQGMFRALGRMSPEAKQATTRATCDQCVRQPAWMGRTVRFDDIGCGEPCNTWLSAALEMMA